MSGFKSVAAIAIGAVALAYAGSASAHVWNIGWKSTGGNLTFYGVSYYIAPSATLDDFVANPAGFVINGMNVAFDTGSVVDLEDCSGPGGLTAGSCSAIFNGLGLDGALASSQHSFSWYGKYATTMLDSTQLAGLGIGTGNNSITLSTFANNAEWDGLTFSPINIVVQPVPEAATLGLFGLGLAGLGLAVRRRRTV